MCRTDQRPYIKVLEKPASAEERSLGPDAWNIPKGEKLRSVLPFQPSCCWQLFLFCSCVMLVLFHICGCISSLATTQDKKKKQHVACCRELTSYFIIFHACGSSWAMWGTEGGNRLHSMSCPIFYPEVMKPSVVGSAQDGQHLFFFFFFF